jgi:hypothetical protein
MIRKKAGRLGSGEHDGLVPVLTNPFELTNNTFGTWY